MFVSFQEVFLFSFIYCLQTIRNIIYTFLTTSTACNGVLIHLSKIEKESHFLWWQFLEFFKKGKDSKSLQWSFDTKNQTKNWIQVSKPALNVFNSWSLGFLPFRRRRDQHIIIWVNWKYRSSIWFICVGVGTVYTRPYRPFVTDNESLLSFRLI